MFRVRAAVAAHPPPFFSAATFKSHPRLSLRMSSCISDSTKIIEHIVLFKVKPTAEPSAVNAMITNLNGLISLDPVLHFSAGSVSRSRSSSLTFTHLLHSRYRSKADLSSYSDHPTHLRVVADYVKPVVDDVMAVDWVAEDFSGPVTPPPGSALRLTVLKLKEGDAEGGRNEVLKVLRGIKEKFPSIEQLTVGENFSPGRNKGYSICSIGVFKGMKELEGSDSDSERANEEKDKVREFLDEVLVLDFAVAALVQPANL